MIDWIKAKIALLLIGAIWATLFILMLPLLIIAIIYDAKVKTHSYRGWAYSLLIAQDHCVNAMQSDDIYNWSTSRALLGALIYFCGVYAIMALLCS
jgi:hypothetical protein